MRESRIDADERLGLHERGRHAVEPRARRDDGIGNEAGQPLDAFPLLVVAPEKDAAASLIEKRTAEIDPMVFGPELFVAARVDGERHPGTFGDLERLRPGRKPEGGGVRGHFVAERLGREQPVALHGPHFLGNPMGMTVEEGGRGLAHRIAAEAVHGRARPGGGPGRAKQTLLVDHHVVTLRSERRAQRPNLGEGLGREDVLAPAAKGADVHLRDDGRERGDLLEAFFGEPVHLRVGEVFTNVDRDGQGVNDVAHARRFDDEDLHAAPSRTARKAAAGSPPFSALRERRLPSSTPG